MIRIALSMLVLFLFFSSCRKDLSDSPGNNFSEISVNEILGRPTNSSITVSILTDENTEIFIEYGTTAGKYSYKTENLFIEKDVPFEAEITGLSANTKYYYRNCYRPSGETSAFTLGSEFSFVTQRSVSSAFTFAIEADPHLDSNSDTSAFSLTLKNILASNPDFLIDLGDTFFSEKQSLKTQAVITERHLLYRPYFGRICHSASLFLALGNHEGESGWVSSQDANSLPVLATNTRKLYYPNPFPNSFYEGSSRSETYTGLRENYYSWEWGNALFIVLDPYYYTKSKPDWGWTLGEEQYNWFKKVMTTSQAKFRFVFCHNLVGGFGNDARGGAEAADYFEMGGMNSDGTYGFDNYRPGWGKPIHDIMKENGKTIFFHGHDHFFGKQDKDGVIYQECPQPSNRDATKSSSAEYGYTEGVLMPGRGYLRVNVSSAEVTVEFVGTFLPAEEKGSLKNGGVLYTYTLN